MQNRNIRIKDIAERAGVSIGTVDRVLHKRGEVAEDTRMRILQIVEELGYRPNILASTLASKKGIRVATLTPQPLNNDSYWNKPFEGITQGLSKIASFGIKAEHYFFEMEQPGSFTATAEELLQFEPDAVLLAPWDEREALQFTEKLDKLTIPYIFIDSHLEGAHPFSFVIQDARQSGRLAARLIDYGLPDNATILLLHITRNGLISSHLADREQGFLDYFKEKEKPSCRIVKLECSGSSIELKAKIAAEGLSVCEVDAVFVTNSKVHLIADIFTANCSMPRIIGYDLISNNVAMLKRGVVDFLISQKPEKQGYIAINLLFDYIVKKERVPSCNYMPIDIISSENLAYYSFL